MRARDAAAGSATGADSFGPAAADAAELEGMGVDEAYEEQGAVDVDGMTYEARSRAQPTCAQHVLISSQSFLNKHHNSRRASI